LLLTRENLQTKTPNKIRSELESMKEPAIDYASKMIPNRLIGNGRHHLIPQRRIKGQNINIFGNLTVENLKLRFKDLHTS
jgi:hypothetical protein